MAQPPDSSKLYSAIEQFEAAIRHYKEAIAAIEAAKKNGEKLSAHHILELIITRNAVEDAKNEAIKAEKKYNDAINWTLSKKEPNDLKDRLKKANEDFKTSANDLNKQIESIKRTIKLFELQDSNEKDWWWLLHPITPRPWRDSFDWFWRFLSILSLTISVSLLLDSSTRLLSTGPDLGGFLLVLIPSTLTLVISGGTFTKPGREAIEGFLKSFNFKKSW